MEQKQKTALHSSLSRALSVLFWFFRISSLLRYYGGYKPSRRRKMCTNYIGYGEWRRTVGIERFSLGSEFTLELSAIVANVTLLF